MMLDLSGNYFTSTLWLQTVTLPLFCAIFAALVALCFASPTKRRTRFVLYFLIAFGAALLGAVTGQITGQSREPAVSAVLPAVLGLVGGTVVYLVGTQGVRVQFFVGIAIVSMMLNMILGIGWGSRLRSISEGYAAVRKADNDYRGALRSLKHEINFARVKEKLAKQHNRELRTSYPPISSKKVGNNAD